MPRPRVSLSLDLDNKWSYLKTHGEAAWRSFPSYLDVVVPRVLAFLAQRNWRITFFVVGQDAARRENHDVLASLAAAGHEIGNHSFHHEPWLHLYSDAEVDAELAQAHDAIAAATGQSPLGFRGPGFSWSPAVLRALARQGYVYDASSLPTFLGPLARMYYFFTARLDREERRRRAKLFGTLKDGFGPLRPYWHTLDGSPPVKLLEIPVTTMPLFKTPIHLSYLLYLAKFSRPLALAYWRMALALCRMTGVEPSILLHPLDFMGRDDDAELGFFPAMDLASGYKLELCAQMLDLLPGRYEIVTMRDHAAAQGATLPPKSFPLETDDAAAVCPARQAP